MTLHPRWFVAHTHPHAEAKATAHLNRQGFEVYFPRYLKATATCPPHRNRRRAAIPALFVRRGRSDGAALAFDLFDRRGDSAGYATATIPPQFPTGSSRDCGAAKTPAASSSLISGRHFARATRFACSMAHSRPALACSKAW